MSRHDEIRRLRDRAPFISRREREALRNLERKERAGGPRRAGEAMRGRGR